MSGHVGKKLIRGLIHIYQWFLSPDKNVLVRIGALPSRPTCVFYPTCSEYMIGAVEKYGVIKGMRKGIIRIGKCRKGTEPSVDTP
jgi:putative component of membrane protein insertase Oxa1/YidC/SpoIIIJ protein YidD